VLLACKPSRFTLTDHPRLFATQPFDLLAARTSEAATKRTADLAHYPKTRFTELLSKWEGICKSYFKISVVIRGVLRSVCRRNQGERTL
jgi:hypothetical protein